MIAAVPVMVVPGVIYGGGGFDRGRWRENESMCVFFRCKLCVLGFFQVYICYK